MRNSPRRHQLSQQLRPHGHADFRTDTEYWDAKKHLSAKFKHIAMWIITSRRHLASTAVNGLREGKVECSSQMHNIVGMSMNFDAWRKNGMTMWKRVCLRLVNSIGIHLTSKECMKCAHWCKEMHKRLVWRYLQNLLPCEWILRD